MSVPLAKNPLLVDSRCSGSELTMPLSDIIMPNASGVDLARILHETRPHLRTLFMSGYTADAIPHSDQLRYGAGFIQKPFVIGDLAVKVRQVFDGGSEDGTAPGAMRKGRS